MTSVERLKQLFDYRDGNFYRKSDGQQANYPNYAGYEKICVDGKRYRFHHMVYMYHHGYKPEQLDHINGNRSDNRIENLREATSAENRMNVGLTEQNKSGIKNVFWNKIQNAWKVQVKHKYGTFTKQVQDLELAELVAIMAREKFHGEFANHGASL